MAGGKRTGREGWELDGSREEEADVFSEDLSER